MFASGCAAARAFYDYCRKTKVKEQKKSTVTVTVEFLIVPDNNGDNIMVNQDEIATLERIANAIKMTARIVDTPCNEMNVNHFLNASPKKKKKMVDIGHC